MKYTAVFIAALLGLAACASEPPQEAPYAAEYAAAIANTNSDYVKAILEDSEVTAAEMHDAQGQFESCLAQAGINAFYEDTGYGFESLSVLGELNQDQWSAEVACRDQWMGSVDFLYEKLVTNPQNQDFDSLVAQCLVRKELVASGFTGTDYSELVTPNLKTETLMPGEQTVFPHPPEIFLPVGVSLDEPAAALCTINPTM